MFHRARWTSNQELLRPESREADIVEADLLIADGGSRITAETNLERLVSIYGSNPLTYPKCIYATYMELLRRWSR